MAASMAISTEAGAQNYPSRNITIVQPYAPGGANDVSSRILAEFIGKELGTSVIVDNRPGASGVVAINAVKRADADGYTLGWHSIATSLSYMVQGNDLVIGRDLDAVGQLQESSNFVVINPRTIPVKTLAELVSYLKANPRTLNATIQGAPNHIVMSDFAAKQQLQVQHVPYRGGPQGIQALLSGEVGLFFGADGTSIQSHVEAGTLLALATNGPKRSGSFPNVPTVAELGFPDMEFSIFAGIVAPHGTPKPIIDRLSAVMQKAQQTPEVAKRIEAASAVAAYLDAAQFTQRLNKAGDVAAKVIKENKIKAE
jgi:tripartite-type tricarboxylate transporter receptor subunit TctC